VGFRVDGRRFLHVGLPVELVVAVRQPSPPLCECVTRMAGPILLNSAETASVFTCTSYGPVFGTISRKNWLSASGSRENYTPG
jgi:hypothetical protein